MTPLSADKMSEIVFNIRSDNESDDLALQIFHLQYEKNEVYRKFCDLINANITEIRSWRQVPFLPVELFKTHQIGISGEVPEHEFHSSGTTTGNTSRHLVFDMEIYRNSILKGFNHFYGDPKQYCFVILVPSISEHPHSSLAFMADMLIKKSAHPLSGFYLGRETEIPAIIRTLHDRKLYIFGLSYALADLAGKEILRAPAAIIMETGGMKGRRKELTREELHSLLKAGFGVNEVHSEYSMCELFSQAYSFAEGIFSCPPWMKVVIRDMHDPFTLLDHGQSGGVNIVDLANVHTCSFISTQDIGKTNSTGEFEILGRIDNSDLRGCSLMI
jgi:hypothetical protein